MIKKILAFAAITIVVACSSNPISNTGFFKSSPRSKYERKFKGDERTLTEWKSAHEQALHSPRAIKLPHSGNGLFKAAQNVVYSYAFELQTGEIFDAEVLIDTPDCKVFITLFNANDLSGEVHTNSYDDKHLRFPVSESGNYILTIQPEVAVQSKCKVFINKQPSYGFPVAGKGNSAIQSFWDAPRDNGGRRHEGVDIFAKKGTPVVAVIDGMVYDTGDRGLGGKQVWQRSGLFGTSIYYAHLDRIAVEAGNSVKTGDTIGYVGNTGNAKGGPAHLHFGIYDGWKGAVDPLPFIYHTKQIKANRQ